MQPCSDFRTRLSALLSGRAPAPEWTALAWHEHLHTCAECRDLLEAEEALEVLLKTLPEPRLPRALCERVLERLAAARPGLPEDLGETADTGLDRLLDLAEVTPPGELASKVLRGLRDPRLAARQERDLDDLLESVPAVETPGGLAERVLEGLRNHRTGRPVLRPIARGSWSSMPVRWAAAAVVLVSLALGLWRTAARSEGEDRALPTLARGMHETTQPTENIELVTEDPSDELLASLDLLESWEFLMGDDVEQVLASLDTLDELGLYLDEEGLGG